MSLSDVILTWCDTFANDGVYALAGSSVTRQSISLVLQEIDAEYTRLTTPRAAPDAVVTDRLSEQSLPERHLNEILDVICHLPEFVTGLPSHVESDGAEIVWEPSDSVVDSLLVCTIPKLGQMPNSLAPHDDDQVQRLLWLARCAAANLVEHFERTGRGGVSLADVGSAAASAGPQAVEVHRRFADCITRLRESLLTDDEPQGGSLQALSSELLEAWGEWSDLCLGAVPMKRHTRQSKRRNLARCIGAVAKYGHLSRGADSRAVLCHAIHCIRTTAVKAATLAVKLVGASPAEGAAGFSARRRDAFKTKLSRLLVDPAVLAMWRERLEVDAARCSRLIRNVVADLGQDEPWLVGEKCRQLAHSGILRAPTEAEQSRELIELLHRMQRVGLAAQLRWGCLDGRVNALPRGSGHRIAVQGSQWLVNPLGIAIADHLRR